MEDELLEQLIIDGYLPEQLPPFFNTMKIYVHYSELVAAITNPGRGYYDCVNFTVPKNNKARRLLQVPNPIRQLLLIDYILENKVELESVFYSNYPSLSNPFYYSLQAYDELWSFDLQKLKDTKINDNKSTFLKNLQEKMDISLGFKYCYKIDVANFYDSIYTHSIEWKFIGRDESKRREQPENMGKKLDRLISQTNSKETSGIPTGPFTSRIISELILSGIDEELKELSLENDDIFKFTHYVDDYEFYFREESDIHRMKNKIIEIFSLYRLKINENKTSIDLYPFHNLVDIKREYSFYINQYNQKEDEQNLRLLFFKADELTQRGIKGAYKYLYKILNDKEKVNLEEHWHVIESFLIGHLLINPSLGQYIVKVILMYKDQITDRLKQEIFKNLELSMTRHLHNEVHWLLWALLQINYKFNAEELGSLYMECDDDLTKIMLVHTIYEFKLDESRDIKALLKAEVESLKDLTFEHERWLLIHEWYMNQWVDYKEFQELYNGCQFYQVMKKLGISFIE